MMPAQPLVNARFNKSTFYLTENGLYLLSAKKGRGLIPTQVNSSNCLFASAGPKPLVRLEGSENVNQLKTLLTWSIAADAFVGYDKLLEQSSGEGATTLSYQSDDWKQFTQGGDARFFRMLPDFAPTMERAFTAIMPADFNLTPELSNSGVPLETVPRPGPDGKSLRRFR